MLCRLFREITPPESIFKETLISAFEANNAASLNCTFLWIFVHFGKLQMIWNFRSVIRCLHYFLNFLKILKRQEAWILYINNIINYLGIPSDLPELLLTGNVFWVIFELGVAIGVKIGLSAGSPPPMASVEYLIFVYSRVLFWKKKRRRKKWNENALCM